MQNYFALAAPQITNAEIDTSPLRNALSDFAQSQRQAQQDKIAAEQRNFERGRQLRADQRAEGELLAKQALAADQLTDPAARQATLERILARHPDRANLSAIYTNPDTAFKAIAADWGMFSDPMKKQKDELELAQTKADIAYKQAQALKTNRDVAQLDQELELTKGLLGSNGNAAPTSNNQSSLDTVSNNTPSSSSDNSENLTEIINQLPRSQQIIAKTALIKKDMTTLNKILEPYAAQSTAAKNITGALVNLRNSADKYDEGSFSNAMGPLQGAIPSEKDYLKPFLIGLSRFGGEVLNKLPTSMGGGDNSVSTVRDDILGSTQALAAAVKPLVKKGAEGAWSDSDQAALERIVGNLASAKNKQDFYNRLNDVRDRIQSTFGVKIDFDALKNQTSLPKTQNKPQVAPVNSSRVQYVGPKQ